MASCTNFHNFPQASPVTARETDQLWMPIFEFSLEVFRSIEQLDVSLELCKAGADRWKSDEKKTLKQFAQILKQIKFICAAKLGKL